MPKIRLIALLSLFLSAVSWAQTQQAAVKKVLDDYVAANRVVGASVAVLKDDGVLFAAGAGFQDREQKLAAGPETVYRLGSISKPVTAVAAMQMVEAGKISLFSYVGVHVPEWPDKKAHITLRHLLTHTSGIRHYIATKRDVYFEPFTVTRSLDVFKGDDLLFKPGERVSYSTHAFSLVARMVETASGEEFAAYVSKRVAGPADAPSLSLEDRSKPNANRSQLYDWVGNGDPMRAVFIENISWKSGGGGMESSAPDLARFGRAVLTNKLLASQTTDFMFQKQVVDGLDTGRGIGWDLDSAGNPEHGGAQQGCRALMKIDKATRTVFVVMTNTGGSHPIGQLLQGVITAWKATSDRPVVYAK